MIKKNMKTIEVEKVVKVKKEVLENYTVTLNQDQLDLIVLLLGGVNSSAFPKSPYYELSDYASSIKYEDSCGTSRSRGKVRLVKTDYGSMRAELIK